MRPDAHSAAATAGEREALVPPAQPRLEHTDSTTSTTATDSTSIASPSMALPTRMSPTHGGGNNSGGSLPHLLSSLATATPDWAAVYFFRSSAVQHATFLVVSVATFGLLPIVCMWVPQLYTRLTKRQVASLDLADHVLVKYVADLAAGEAGTTASVTWTECAIHSLHGVSWIDFKKSRHFYDAKKQGFVRLQNELQERFVEVDKSIKAGGLSGAKAAELLEIYGPNVIDLAPSPWQKVLLRKLLHPFYLFQVFSALIWFSESYTTYALIILLLSALSTAWEVHAQVTNDTKLHELVHVDASVKVLRDQHVQSVSVAQLVVGDVVVVEEGVVPADLLLVTGECTADESTLTGEAIPITKLHLLHATSDTRVDATLKVTKKESVLFAGSTVLTAKADNSTRAVVLATGFSTSKGELFRAIVYPKPINFKIEQDSYRFLAALSVVALLAFVKRMVQAAKSTEISTGDALVSSLDLVTIAVPPALPLILTVGIDFALKRLEAAGIFCINSKRINLAGHVDTFCFDKTGTLSNDHLDFQGVDECSTTSASFLGLQSEVDVLSTHSIVGLATCHGLNERSGQVTGYALERDMFKATGYSIETNVHKRNTPNAPFSVLISSPIGKTFGVVKRYLFDASLQRSSVLIEDFESGQRVVYTKGSPEALLSVCNPASIPANYMDKTRAYAYQGYYVVALASKTYPVTADVPQREAMECRLHFLGFVLFLNKIKTESPYVIATLEEASVDVRIITGDNAFTAIHVARKINMELHSTVLLLDVVPSSGGLMFADVDELATQSKPQWTPLDAKTFLSLTDNNAMALTGAALEQLQATQPPLFVEQLVLHTKIFSRIRPHQKTWLVETLIQRGRVVAMVGDGTNDCGALKAAHVGVALSDADASIVAPFTSRRKQITDVVALLREGRCALSTAFVAFKYMVLYSIIQLTMSSLMNDYASQMSNNQFLFDDLVVVFGLSLLMVRTAASERLTRETPATSLFSPTILISLAGQIMLLFVCLGIAISSAKAKDWYCAADHARELTKGGGNSSTIAPPCYVFVPGEPADLTQHSYENSVLWLFGHLQYWIVALAFNAKDTFRKPLFSNKAFAFYLALLFVVLHVQLFSYRSAQATETVGVDTSLGVLKLPAGFEASLFFLFLFDLLLALVWELLVVGVLVARLQQRRERGDWGFSKRKSSSRVKANSYVADRDSLLAGSSEYKATAATTMTTTTTTKAKKNDRVGNAVAVGVDFDDDEEEDVLTRHEIV